MFGKMRERRLGQAAAEHFHRRLVRDLAERLAAMAPEDPKAAERAKALVVTAAYMAFAEGLIGDILTPMLGAPEGLFDAYLENWVKLLTADRAVQERGQ